MKKDNKRNGRIVASIDLEAFRRWDENPNELPGPIYIVKDPALRRAAAEYVTYKYSRGEIDTMTEGDFIALAKELHPQLNVCEGLIGGYAFKWLMGEMLHRLSELRKKDPTDDTVEDVISHLAQLPTLP